jgi:hypothetical protein
MLEIEKLGFQKCFKPVVVPVYDKPQNRVQINKYTMSDCTSITSKLVKLYARGAVGRQLNW